jgi:integrase
MPDFSHITSLLSQYNRGEIMRARVYADVKSGKCACGGKFTDKMSYPNKPLLLMPICDVCRSEPAFYVIDCDAIDINGEKIRHKIRHTKDRVRLDNAYAVAYILDVIAGEMKNGEFDIRYYDSAKTKESFLFKNYARDYLKRQLARLDRGEIAPKTFENCKSLTENHLLSFFGEFELSKINTPLILRYRDSFTSKERTKNLATNELKAILNQAVKDDMLRLAPKFPRIPKAKMRENIISYELALDTIKAVKLEVYRDFFSVLLNIPLRPCELNALTWKDVDFDKNEITINKHHSKAVVIEGRKSISKDKKQGVMKYQFGIETRDLLIKQRLAMITSLNSHVFLNSSGTYLKKEGMNDAWTKARNILNHKHHLYELRHRSSTRLHEITGDLVKTAKYGGWSNIQTPLRYIEVPESKQVLFQ